MEEPIKEFTLCGVQGCCPTVKVGAQGAVLTDDNGGKVVLTADEWSELKNLITQGEL